MTAAQATTGARFCGHCTQGAHRKCAGPCACSDARHSPPIELARQMAASRCPDLAPAIRAGRLDNRVREAFPTNEGVLL